MNEAAERLYQWYLLGCRMEEQIPMSREAFMEERLLQALSGDLLCSEIFNRTAAEWELAREDALWTTILQRLSNMNFSPETGELVAAIKFGRDIDEDGEAGSAGVPAWLPPFTPVLVGAAAMPYPTRSSESLLADAVALACR